MYYRKKLKKTNGIKFRVNDLIYPSSSDLTNVLPYEDKNSTIFLSWSDLSLIIRIWIYSFTYFSSMDQINHSKIPPLS